MVKSCPLRLEDPIITIVIPTKGRKTLKGTIQSLLDQSCGAWKALIVCDGFFPSNKCSDSRIKYIECSKLGINNNAGNVRNYGIGFVDTKWIGFVDDDDSLNKDYIKTLYGYDRTYDDIDIIIYTMVQDGRLIPSRWNNDIVLADIGISYAYKASWSLKGGYYFNQSGCEDYDHVKRMSDGGAKYIIDRDIGYYVRPHGLEEYEDDLH